MHPRALISGGYKSGTEVDHYGVINNSGRGLYIYLAAYKTRGAVYDARYTLELNTVRPSWTSASGQR